MNTKEIAFIICVNDTLEYSECKYYLDRLIVPDGYKKDVLAVQEAPSMTAGYNAGMQSSDAKYKVYMHQDVFIKNIHFIEDILNVFESDEKIGLLGMVGTRNLGTDAVAVTSWDSGKVINNCIPSVIEFPSGDEECEEVQAIDGLLMATQYDILWREDIFDGWDFYDISQCMEFRRRGYKVVVPYQEESWCYHDNAYSKMTRYEEYRKRFLKEYTDMGAFQIRERSANLLEYEQAKEAARQEVAGLFTAGNRFELRQLFQNPNYQGFLYLREYETMVWIDEVEEMHNSSIRFWRDGEDLGHLLHKLRVLKFILKRLEYGAEQEEKDREFLKQNYSDYAVIGVRNMYINDVSRIPNEGSL